MTAFKPESSQLQPEHLVDLLKPTNVRLSPSAKHVVYSAAPGGKKEEHVKSSLWIGEVGKKHYARQLTSGSYNDRQPSWAPDGTNRLAFLSDRGDDESKTCAIYIIHLDGGEPYAVTPAKHKRSIDSFSWSPNGKFIAFTSADEKTSEQEKKEKDRDDVEVFDEDVQYARLRVLNVETREIRTLYEQNRHVQSFCWSPDGKQLVVVSGVRPNDAFESGKRCKVDILQDRKVVKSVDFEGRIYSSTWHRDAMYFLASVTPTSICSSSALYRGSLSGSDDELRFVRHAYGLKEDALGLKTCHGKGAALFVQAGMRDEVHSLDGEVLWSAEQEHGGDFDVWYDEADKSKNVVALVLSDVATPREVFTRMPGSEQAVQISNHGASLAQHKIGRYHPLECKSFDNQVTLEGYFTAPFDAEKKPRPTFVWIHGGPYYHKTNSFSSDGFGATPYLLTAEYGILTVNYRGNSGYGDDYARYAKGYAGTVDYDDVVALIQEGIDQGFVDPERIVVAGWSQGGFLSYLTAVRDGAKTLANGEPKTWRVKGVVPGAGVADWDLMTMTSDMPVFQSELAGGNPWLSDKAQTQGRKGSAIWEFKAAAEAKVIPPVLILHGREDVRVPLPNAMAFHRACMHFGIRCELAVYPREPHGVGERLHQIDMIKRIRRFCDTNLC